jgi:hypothetical protein
VRAWKTPSRKKQAAVVTRAIRKRNRREIIRDSQFGS